MQLIDASFVSCLTFVLQHSLKLTDRLLEVCNKPCRKDTKLTMSGDFQILKKMLSDKYAIALFDK